MAKKTTDTPKEPVVLLFTDTNQATVLTEATKEAKGKNQGQVKPGPPIFLNGQAHYTAIVGYLK